MMSLCTRADCLLGHTPDRCQECLHVYARHKHTDVHACMHDRRSHSTYARKRTSADPPSRARAWRSPPTATSAIRSRRTRGPGRVQLKGATTECRHRALTWMQRLKRVFKIDIEICRRCGGTLKITSCIEDAVVIARVLEHLDRKAVPELSAHAPRAPRQDARAYPPHRPASCLSGEAPSCRLCQYAMCTTAGWWSAIALSKRARVKSASSSSFPPQAECMESSSS